MEPGKQNQAAVQGRAKRLGRWFLWGCGGLLLVCLLAAGISAGINAVQPKSSKMADQLDEVSKAQLGEINHLRQTLGEKVWPGWGDANVPIVLYNERYAFLTGLEQPETGWRQPLKTGISGGDWKVMPGDIFAGQIYYRQPVENGGAAIGNFVVLVGEHWSASMETQEWSGIAFRQGLQKDLPPLMREVFPYSLMNGQLLGRSDVYLGGLAHEIFHAYQGIKAPERLVQAERSGKALDIYPWGDDKNTSAWRTELGLLRQALQSTSQTEAARLSSSFLAARAQRRQAVGLSIELTALERQREWLEGLAKYAELSLGRAAALTPDYVPVAEMKVDSAFKGWSGYQSFYEQQVDQIDKMLTPGEPWFYYSGMAQAALLDRLLPGWKTRALEPGVFLEDLLKEAVLP